MRGGCEMCSRWVDDEHLRIEEFEHSYAILNRDQFFPGYSFLVAKKHLSELFHLDCTERAGFIEEVNRLALALNEVFSPLKINYELLGNMTPHMHWHIIPRLNGDPLWPRPVWSEPHPEKILHQTEYDARITLIKKVLR